jgi:hypothetical protein
MPEDDDLYARTDWLAQQLKQAGLPDAAGRLLHLLHGVAWTTSSELIGELGQALLSVRRLHAAELAPEVLAHLEAAIASARKVWPDLSEPETAPSCESCERVHEPIEIRLPGQLRRLLHALRELVEASQLRVLTQAECTPNEPPFLSLLREGPWPDVLNYRFQCNRCGTYFALSAETYHGSGGAWKPVL